MLFASPCHDLCVIFLTPLQELLDGGVEHPVMAVVRVFAQVGRESSQEKAPVIGVFLAVAAKEGSSVFVAVIPPEVAENDGVLRWKQMDCSPGSGTIGW